MTSTQLQQKSLETQDLSVSGSKRKDSKIDAQVSHIPCISKSYRPPVRTCVGLYLLLFHLVKSLTGSW